MLISTIEELDVLNSGVDDSWDEFAASVPGGHHVQSTGWGRVKASQGWDVRRLAVRSGSDVVGGAQLAMKRLPILGPVGYVDGGPLVSDDASIDSVLGLLDAAVDDLGLAALIVQPPEQQPVLQRALLDAGYGPTPVSVSLGATVLTDVTAEPDELLGRMKSKTRYNIRRSLRAPLDVRIGGEQEIEVFSRMLRATGARQKFTPDVEAVAEMIRQMSPDTEILLAEHDSRPIAGILTVRFGDRVVYKRGAWSGEGGNLHPNERLHWEAMQRARAHGAAVYDFDGIDRAVAEAVVAGGAIPPQESRSLSSFKLGFGGEAVILPDPLIRIPTRLLRWGHDIVYPRVTSGGAIRRIVDFIRR